MRCNSNPSSTATPPPRPRNCAAASRWSWNASDRATSSSSACSTPPKRQNRYSGGMRIPFYHVDAFAGRPFAGNPAAVCPLEAWLSDATLQAIAAEHNLSETAFYVARGTHYELRWFTPEVEIDLCGHATVASAHVIFDVRRENSGTRVTFQSMSGELG